jgi:hypothetical protein
LKKPRETFTTLMDEARMIAKLGNFEVPPNVGYGEILINKVVGYAVKWGILVFVAQAKLGREVLLPLRNIKEQHFGNADIKNYIGIKVIDQTNVLIEELAAGEIAKHNAEKKETAATKRHAKRKHAASEDVGAAGGDGEVSAPDGALEAAISSELDALGEEGLAAAVEVGAAAVENAEADGVPGLVEEEVGGEWVPDGAEMAEDEAEEDEAEEDEAEVPEVAADAAVAVAPKRTSKRKRGRGRQPQPEGDAVAAAALPKKRKRGGGRGRGRGRGEVR